MEIKKEKDEPRISPPMITFSVAILNQQPKTATNNPSEDRIEYARSNDDAMDGDSVNLARAVEAQVVDFGAEENLNNIAQISVSDLIEARKRLNDSKKRRSEVNGIKRQKPIYRTETKNRWETKEKIWLILVSMHFHKGNGKKTDWSKAFEFIKFNRSIESVQTMLKRLKRNPSNRVTHALRQKAKDVYGEIFGIAQK